MVNGYGAMMDIMVNGYGAMMDIMVNTSGRLQRWLTELDDSVAPQGKRSRHCCQNGMVEQDIPHKE